MVLRTTPARTLCATLALFAGTALAGVAAAPSATAAPPGRQPAPAAASDAIGTTPGTYTDYAFPSSVTGLTSVTWSTTVTDDPGHTANTFWSHQFGFDKGDGAYIGQQRNGGETSTFLFSVWDTTEAKPGGAGTSCTPFGGEGEGMSCRARLDWSTNHTYRYTVAAEGGGWFGATVTDEQTHESVKLGSVRTPATAISPAGMVDWTEYFEWNDTRATCGEQPSSAAVFGLPTGRTADGADVTAHVSGTKVTDNACKAHTSVADAPGGGTVQLLVHDNSARGAVTTGDGRPERCLAPKRTDADGHAVDGTPAVLTGCADGTAAAAQAWVLSADGTLRSASDHCLAAEENGALTVRDCKPHENADFTVADPAERWTFDAGRHLLRNTASGRYLARDGNTVALRAAGTEWTLPARS